MEFLVSQCVCSGSGCYLSHLIDHISPQIFPITRHWVCPSLILYYFGKCSDVFPPTLPLWPFVALILQSKLSTFGSTLWAFQQATPPAFGHRNQAHALCNQAHDYATRRIISQAHDFRRHMISATRRNLCRAMITSPIIYTPRLVYSFKCKIYRKCTCRLIILIYHLLFVLLWIQSRTQVRGVCL